MILELFDVFLLFKRPKPCERIRKERGFLDVPAPPRSGGHRHGDKQNSHTSMVIVMIFSARVAGARVAGSSDNR